MDNKYLIRLYNHSEKNILANPLDDCVDYYDLTFVISGELLYIIDDEYVTVKARDAIFIPSGSKRVRLKGKQPTEYISINFFSSGQEGVELPILIPNCFKEVKELLAVFDKTKEDYIEEYTKAKQEKLVEIILLILKENSEKSKRSGYTNRIVQYIQQNYMNKITLKDIADTVHLSVPYCCNIVKKELGLTVNELIRQKRVGLAKEYIMLHQLPLKEISVKCGFDDYVYFTKCFKKHTGYTPSQFKNNCYKKGE